MSFRLNWTIKQFFNFRDFSAHKATLRSPWKFYLGMLLKVIPGFYKRNIQLEFTNGNKIVIREFMSLYIYKEIFIDGCYDHLPVSNTQPVVIEIGANTGFFALRIRDTYPGSEIVSFEPYPPNYAALLETITMNNMERITPVQKAVADKPGRLKLYIHPHNVGGHSIFSANSGKEYVEVEATTIGSILSDHGIAGCDLLKLDCEGAEYPILKSLSQEVADRIRTIIYEPTHGQYSVEELNLFLQSLGYQTSLQSGLVVAARNGD